MTALMVIAGTLVALVLIIAGIGYLLPVQHTATRERSYNAPVNALFAAVSNTADYPRWRRGVTRVESLTPLEGRPRFREVGSEGQMTFVMDEIVPDRRIVSRIADTTLPFGGRWTYEFISTGEGSRLRITEDGEVYNPIFRFMARFVFGHERTMENCHDDLERYLTARSARR
jgi:uncharacterized protein YndB with AHSA1/START domain